MKKLDSFHKGNLNEGLEYGDLRRLVKPLIQIDGFKSKMGDDDGIVVLCFAVKEKTPAEDLMEFLEKSYDPVLDADLSDGQDDKGAYMVFVELSREEKLPKIIIDIIEDLNNLTGNKMEDWRFTYYRDPTSRPLTLENLQEVIPLSPREYRMRFEKKPKRNKNSRVDDIDAVSELNQLRAVSGVPVPSSDTRDDELQEMQRAAGIL